MSAAASSRSLEKESSFALVTGECGMLNALAPRQRPGEEGLNVIVIDPDAKPVPVRVAGDAGKVRRPFLR